MSVSILPVLRFFYLASQMVDHELQAIADAEHRHTEIENAQVGAGSVFVIDRRRASLEDDTDWVVLVYVFNLSVTRKDNRKDILLADPAGDELRILRPEVENYD